MADKIVVHFKERIIASDASDHQLRIIQMNPKYFTKTDSPFVLDKQGNRFELMNANPLMTICERCRMSVIPIRSIEEHKCIEY